jgi:hypothetical protein
MRQLRGFWNRLWIITGHGIPYPALDNLPRPRWALRLLNRGRKSEQWGSRAWIVGPTGKQTSFQPLPLAPHRIHCDLVVLSTLNIEDWLPRTDQFTLKSLSNMSFGLIVENLHFEMQALSPELPDPMG